MARLFKDSSRSSGSFAVLLLVFLSLILSSSVRWEGFKMRPVQQPTVCISDSYLARLRTESTKPWSWPSLSRGTLHALVIKQNEHGF